MHDVRKRAGGKDVIKQNGSGDAEVAIADVRDPSNVFPDRGIPRFFVTLWSDVKAEVFGTTCKTNVSPRRGNVDQSDVAAVGRVAPGRNDERR